jgi:hypothetical protein
MIKVTTGGKVYLFEDFDGLIEAMDSEFEEEALEEYRAMLDDAYGDVEICGYTYSSSRVFEEIDPTAFRCGLLDNLDSLSQDIESTLEGGEPYYMGNLTITKIEEDEE